jgi:hypothetical protein
MGFYYSEKWREKKTTNQHERKIHHGVPQREEHGEKACYSPTTTFLLVEDMA